MTQKNEIRQLIFKLCEEDNIIIFTRTEFLERYLKLLQNRWPGSKTPSQTVSRILQELRDDGEIQFLQRGVYKLLKSEFII